MDTIKVRLFAILIAVIEGSASLSESAPGGAYGGDLPSRDLVRPRRSGAVAQKRYFVNPIHDSESGDGQFSLQYIDQLGGGQFYSQPQTKGELLTGARDYKFATVKEGKTHSSFGKAVAYQKGQPYRFIYAEPFHSHGQSHQFEAEAHKLLSIPEKITVEPHSYAALSHHSLSDEHHEEDQYASKYKFGYRVSDPHAGAEFGHSEVSEGHTKKGQYHVLLPDGRLQNVKYWTDPTGYHATVTYEGQAYHPPHH